ncbi:MAG: type IX secretion system protein PorQ [Muribaculaceae bacterium]|nr:type IX secretion system protein PorQ [Muribaculaceae bacterium]
MNLFEKWVLSLVCVILSSLSVIAQDGSTAYNFLNLSSSSHVYGLGGVNLTVIDDDLNLIDQNPALLGPEIESQLAFNYMRYVGDGNFAGVKYGRAAGEHGAWAAGIQYFGYGEMSSADETGIINGSFSPKDVNFSATYSHDITDYWRGGITLKGVYSSYDAYSAFAVAADLGVNYYDADKDMSLSLVVSNLGGQVKRFNESYDRLPVDVRLGWSQSVNGGPIRLSVTAWNLTKWSLPYYDNGDGTTANEGKLKDSFSSNLLRHLVFAGEYVPNERFYIGVGYNYKTRTDMSTYQRNMLSGFSICAGLKVKQFSVGVALAQPHVGGTTFMLNLATRLYEF